MCYLTSSFLLTTQVGGLSGESRSIGHRSRGRPDSTLEVRTETQREVRVETVVLTSPETRTVGTPGESESSPSLTPPKGS